MTASPNEEDPWKKYKEATCLIETRDSQGNGFFFGGGWVMSVAHNFQNNADFAQLHSLLSQASFQFTVNGQQYDFSPQRRMAFIHHLQPGDTVDPDNMDIAMVKLGKQDGYGRSNFEQWEMDEQNQLDEMHLRNVFATIDNRQTESGDIVYAIHYGGEDPNVGRTALTVTQTSTEMPTTAVPNDDNDMNATNVGENPSMELRPTMEHGASGSPIINRNFKLVSLLVGDGESTDVALMWNDGIKQFVNSGAQIITAIDGYMAYKSLTNSVEDINRKIQQIAAEAKKKLEKEARNANLTVYLMNDEVINGPEANGNTTQ